MGFSKDKDGHTKIAEGWGMTLKELRQQEEDFCLRTAVETRREHGVSTPSVGPLYYHIDGTPLHRLDGTQISRDRLAEPPNVKDKYRGKTGDGVHLYFRPGFGKWLKANPKTPIRLVEGEMKARAVSSGVGFQGVSGWQSKGTPAPEFEELRPYLKGRRIEVVPDSDVPGNADSRRWIARLMKHVASLGSKSVEYVPLPTLHVDAEKLRKSKTGLDDFLHEHSFDEFKQLPRIPWDHPQFKEWDTDDADGLPDALLNASMPEAWLDPNEEPPPITWAVNGLVALNETTAIVGGAGSGKTTFTLNLMIGVALGQSVLNLTITKPRRVLYAMLERHANGFWRRVRKAVRCLVPDATNKVRQTLLDNFRPSALAGQPVRLVEHRQNQWIIHKANVDALIERMKEQRIEVLVFDTLSRLHGGNSNDDSLATSLTTAFERITQATGAAVIVLAHTGKAAREDKYALRGSSAWVDNTSNMIHLRLLEEDERDKVKVIGPREAREETLIVEMEHRRMSETTTMPTKHFAIKQGGDMNGWMWSVSIAQKHTPSEVMSQEWFRDWYHENGYFTENAFVTVCMEHVDIGRPRATKLFSELRSKGTIEDTGTKFKNGSRYKLAGRDAGAGTQRAAHRPEKRRKNWR